MKCADCDYENKCFGLLKFLHMQFGNICKQCRAKRKEKKPAVVLECAFTPPDCRTCEVPECSDRMVQP
jgi:hypothetical protein